MFEPRLEAALALVAILGMIPGYGLGWYRRGVRHRRRYRSNA